MEKVKIRDLVSFPLRTPHMEDFKKLAGDNNRSVNSYLNDLIERELIVKGKLKNRKGQEN
jgi:hypothetical protein